MIQNSQTTVLAVIASVLFYLAPSTMTIAQAHQIVEGQHYEKVSGSVSDSAGIEVRVFFFYNCSHCFAVQSELWHRQIPSDVNLVYTPVIWAGRNMEAQAQGFYVAQALGMEETMHSAFFQAFRERRPLATQNDIWSIFHRQGVERQQFDRAWHSYAVNVNMKQGRQLAQQYRVSGSPNIVVGGKYRVLSSGGQHPLNVVDFLVKKIRSDG